MYFSMFLSEKVDFNALYKPVDASWALKGVSIVFRDIKLTTNYKGSHVNILDTEIESLSHFGPKVGIPGSKKRLL